MGSERALQALFLFGFGFGFAGPSGFLPERGKLRVGFWIGTWAGSVAASERFGNEMYRDISPAILDILEPIAAAHGVEIVDAQVSGVPGRGLRLRVTIDTPENEGKVTVGECARFSREVGHGLDAAGSFQGKYMLEVCSPGVDRTLGRWADFERALGREVSVETRAPIGGRRRFRGSLVAAAEEQVRIQLPEGPSVEIPFAQVARAKALFSETAKAKR